MSEQLLPKSRTNRNIWLKKIILLIIVILTGVILSLPGFEIMRGLNAFAIVDFDRIEENELRGVWIASVNNINFPSEKGLSAEQMMSEIDDIIKVCKEANLNAIFFQARPAGDALYDSKIFPPSKYLTGKQGDNLTEGFDPLAYIIYAAHTENIEVHAWLNMYRITNGSKTYPEQDLTALAENNPARKNPSWVVKYDGKLWYNPGLPEVRELITDGVIEIVQNYDVDGIHFDDYFYPYPASGETFDDTGAFEKYGSSGQSLADFRRESVNKTVEEIYKAVKKTNPEVRFGISPFGIWANDSSIPTGSATSGLEAYHSLYSDAKAWINGGYIDYICPQIYWAFNTKAARYDVLVRWWSALVDGTDVDLYIGHAAYKVSSEFQNELELPRQVEFARTYMGVAGSVFYGYSEIAANEYKTKENLAKLFEEDRLVQKFVDNGSGISIRRPEENSYLSGGAVNILGSSNPLFPVYYNGEKIARTQNGFFSLYVNLQDGKNNIYLKSNDTEFLYVINKGAYISPSAPPDDYKYPQMDSYKIEIREPKNNIVTTAGEKIIVEVSAPSKSNVTAKLGDIAIKLTPLTEPPDEGAYMTEIYRGTIILPNTRPQGRPIDLGNIIITAERKNEKAVTEKTNVKIINELAVGPCEVINDYSHLKIAPDSSFYDDYLPASVGMRDVITGFDGGFYLLGFGGYIAAENVMLLPDITLNENIISSAKTENLGDITEIRFAVTENVPIDAKCKDGAFYITLFNTSGDSPEFVFAKNPIFKSARIISDTEDTQKNSATYMFDLIDANNFYGFEVVYEEGFIVLNVKNPMKKIEGNLPLKDLTIIVDAGHGGIDTGALGFLKGCDEKDLNLKLALSVKERLSELGANVIMTREKDETVDIYARMYMLNEINPDLCVSVHCNSVGDEYDISLVRGFEARYCNESGRLLAKICSNEIASALNKVERATLYQSLAMLRNHKFPAALFEMEFITSPDGFEFLLSDEYIKRSSEAIANGIIVWINAQEKWAE